MFFVDRNRSKVQECIFVTHIKNIPQMFEHHSYLSFMTDIIHRIILLQKESSSMGNQRGQNCLIFTGSLSSSTTTLMDNNNDNVPSVVHIEEDSVQIALNPNFESIHELFQKLKYVHHIQLTQFTKLVFMDHNFTQLPTNLASVLPNIKELTITSCKYYNNMDSSIDQFLNLRQINFVKCPALKSLNSMEHISERSKLRHFVFDMCGLEVKPSDTWAEGLQALGRLRVNPMNDCVSITIGSCDQLQSLPSTIGYLKNLPLRLDITFNHRLRRLPHAMGDLIYLKSLICRVSKHITKESLPWSMGRLNPSVLVWLPKKDGIMTIRDLEPYFSQSRKRFLYGLVHLKIALDRFHFKLQHDRKGDQQKHQQQHQQHQHQQQQYDADKNDEETSSKEEMENLRLIIDDIRIECIL